MKKFFFLGMIVLSMLSCKPRAGDYNVVVISMDTTRADYVDTGNGARAFTPELKRFAKKSLVFDRAYCTIPQTLPSHLSMLTSRLPHECGVYSNENPYDGRHKMLQQVFKEKGYITAGVVSLGTLASNTGISEGFDVYEEKLNEKGVFFALARTVTDHALKLLDRFKNEKFFMFLHYSDPHSPYAPPGVEGKFAVEVDGEVVGTFNAYHGAILRMAVELKPGSHQVRFRAPDSPADFNGFVVRRLKFGENCTVSGLENLEFSEKYYGGSHLLKGTEGGFRVFCKGQGSMKIFQVIPLLNWQAAIKYYRGEVEYMDRHVGRFLRALEQKKLLKRTIVVVTADHGEGLGEREMYFGHVRYLNQQFIQVPLVVYMPGQKPLRVARPVSSTGLAPALLELNGIREKGFPYARSLLRVVRQESAATRTVYSFAFRNSAREDKMSVLRWPYQVIYYRNEGGESSREMYNLALSQSFRKWDEFPGQLLLRRSRQEFRRLHEAYRNYSSVFFKRLNNLAKSRVTEKDLEKLRSMGYLQ